MIPKSQIMTLLSIGSTRYDVLHIERENKYEEIAVLNPLAETSGFEVSNHTLKKTWSLPFMKPGEVKQPKIDV